MVKLLLGSDAGHGWERLTRIGDPGAIGRTVTEADYVLNWSNRVNSYIRANFSDVKIVNIRPTNLRLSANNSLIARTNLFNDIVRKTKATHSLLVSYHLNAFDKKAHGFESYVYSPSNVAADKARATIHNRLAKAVSKYSIIDRGKKYGNLHVLRASSSPALLLELGFVDNVTEEQKMIQDKFITDMARETGEAIAAHYGLPRIKSKPEPVKPSTPPSKPIEVNGDSVNPEPSAKYAAAVKWAKENNISDGSTPRAVATRLHSWAFLDRMYDLVKDGKVGTVRPLEQSVTRLKSLGITDGSARYTGVTRKQLWAMLHRIQEATTSKDGKFNPKSTPPKGFNKWMDYAEKWVVDNRITDGGHPDANLSREEILNMLMNYKVALNEGLKK